MEETSRGPRAGARPPGRDVAVQVFEVRVSGLVPDELLPGLAPVEVVGHELRTALLGHFADQAELHGFLARLRAFGLDVVEVRRRVDPAGPGVRAVAGEEGAARR